MPRVFNRKTQRVPPGAVYVGRPSKWGNPWSHLPGTVDPDHLVESRGEAIERFRADLLADEQKMEQVRAELKGKDLVCSCDPLPCHAYVLLEVANQVRR